jgi:hypothetical protein
MQELQAKHAWDPMASSSAKFCRKTRTVQQSQPDNPNPNTAESRVKRAPCVVIISTRKLNSIDASIGVFVGDKVWEIKGTISGQVTTSCGYPVDSDHRRRPFSCNLQHVLWDRIVKQVSGRKVLQRFRAVKSGVRACQIRFIDLQCCDTNYGDNRKVTTARLTTARVTTGRWQQ